MTLDVVQQPHRQQGRQRTQQTAIGHVQRRGEAGGHRSEFTDAGGQTPLDIRRGHAHRGGTVGGAALALGRQRDAGVFFTGLCRRPARTALDKVSGFTPKRSATAAVSKPSSSNCWASTNTAGVNTAGPRPLRGA